MQESPADNTKSPKISTPLSGYKRQKKTLTPPLATIPNMVTSSWINERLPEMLWAALIRKAYPGDIGYTVFRAIMQWLGENVKGHDINGVTHTDIAAYEVVLRQQFIQRVVDQAGTETLRPLLLLPELPAFSDWQQSMKGMTPTLEEDWGHLADAVSLVIFHQTQDATDVRWIKLMGTILSGKIHFQSSMRDKLDEFNFYPNRGDQRSVRPSIRALEMTDNLQGAEYVWAQQFWRYAYDQTLCVPEFDSKFRQELVKKGDDITKDKDFYDKQLQEIRQALIDHFFKTSLMTSIDVRQETTFGLALYALDTFFETSVLLTAGTVSGRVTARIIFEAFATLAYLINNEKNDATVWDGYRNYGTGQISLIQKKYEDENYASNMIDLKTMDNIANEDKWSEYVPINIGHWNETDLRKICIEIDEKDLYDKYYAYTSGYVHANWGAVREASFQTCFNPLHRLHRIPSFGLPMLPSVNEDSRQLLNQILKLVDKAYPSFKHRLHKRPVRKKSN